MVKLSAAKSVTSKQWGVELILFKNNFISWIHCWYSAADLCPADRASNAAKVGLKSVEHDHFPCMTLDLSVDHLLQYVSGKHWEAETFSQWSVKTILMISLHVSWPHCQHHLCRSLSWKHTGKTQPVKCDALFHLFCVCLDLMANHLLKILMQPVNTVNNLPACVWTICAANATKRRCCQWHPMNICLPVSDLKANLYDGEDDNEWNWWWWPWPMTFLIAHLVLYK